jgi:hypothetical protein
MLSLRRLIRCTCSSKSQHRRQQRRRLQRPQPFSPAAPLFQRVNMIFIGHARPPVFAHWYAIAEAVSPSLGATPLFSPIDGRVRCRRRCRRARKTNSYFKTRVSADALKKRKTGSAIICGRPAVTNVKPVPIDYHGGVHQIRPAMHFGER